MYKNNPLNSLYKTVFTIRNEGNETISDISCNIEFEEQEVNNSILEFFAEDRTGKILQNSNININLTNKGVNLSINFLNSFRDYKDKISLTIYSTEPLSVKNATGEVEDGE